MFQFPRCPPDTAARCPAVRRAGCPIRTSPDLRLPAPPRGISPRGRVLPRPPTPRHPPCAHHADILHTFPTGMRRNRDSRPARASGTHPVCRHSAPLSRRSSAPLGGIGVCLCSVALQCARATRHEPPSPTKTGAAQDSDRAMPPRAIAVSHGRRTRRVPRGALSRCRRPSRRSDDPAVVVRSSNLVRSRPPTSDEISQPTGGLLTAAGVLAQRRAARAPGWSRGDSNPGPPPCKGGALPAKLRPPVLSAPGSRPTAAGWARLDSNQGPRPYQGRALTT